MGLFKKDWMYDIKCVVAILVSAMVGLGVAFLLFSGSSLEVRDIMYQSYEQAYTMLSFILGMYPLWAFRAVCPQMGSDKLYINTANLPFSKKDLLFKGLKPWIVIYPIFILFGAGVLAVLSKQTQSFGMLYIFALIKPLSVMVFGIILDLQIISAIIFSLARRIKWYKVTGAVLIFNGAIIALCALFIEIFNIETAHSFMWGVGAIAVVVLATLTMFLIGWRDIENVHR